MERGARAALVVAVLLLAGCFPSNATMLRIDTTPRTVPELSGSVGLTAVPDDPRSLSGGTHFFPNVELGVRQGLSEHVDMGGRLWLVHLGGRVDVKWQFLDTRWVTGAVAPALAIGIPFVAFVGPFPLLAPGRRFDPLRFHLPVLLGLRLGGHTLIVGGKADGFVFFRPTPVGESPARTAYFNPGVVLAFDVDLGRRGRLLPEVNAHCVQGTGLCAVHLAVGWHYLWY